MSAATEALRDHLSACADAFYPGGSGRPDPVICKGERLGVIFDGLAHTHQRCVLAAQTLRRRASADYQLGGIMAVISGDLRDAGLSAVLGVWAAATEAYVEAVEVIEAVAAAKVPK